MTPDIFAVVVLFCQTTAGPAVETCTMQKLEPPHAITLDACHDAAAAFALKSLASNTTFSVRGVRCLKLADLLDDGA